MNKPARLHIVVPYRDRESHLQGFLPHLRAYFARDKLDREIPYRVTIVEQERGLAFNRGAIKNIGFLQDADSDYTCFHDIDYLPLWADYSWTDRPACIVWFGAERRPVAPGRSALFTQHNLDHLFGGAVLIPNGTFRQVNGFSNDYWGWGFEDIDLRRRFDAAKIERGRRKGTFLALNHDSDGYEPDGALKPMARANSERLLRKWSSSTPEIEDSFVPSTPIAQDGLSTISYEILAREKIPDPAPEGDALYEKITVRLGMQPGP